MTSPRLSLTLSVTVTPGGPSPKLTGVHRHKPQARSYLHHAHLNGSHMEGQGIVVPNVQLIRLSQSLMAIVSSFQTHREISSNM